MDWDEIAFLHSKGFFSPQDPRWVATWRLLKQWRPMMSRDLTGTDMMKEFINERGVMYWASSMQVDFQTPTPMGGDGRVSFNGSRIAHSLYMIDGGEAADRGGSPLEDASQWAQA